MIHENDTIAAISTPPGVGGIGIIRISGKDAVRIANNIFHGRISVRDMDSHTIQYGKIVDVVVLDEVMISKMLSPATYTREDVVEINCHGNIISQRKILSLIYKLGARPAEPGEFTKRAFLNGRIDLAQAEAVIDIINSKTERSHDAAITQLSGRVSQYLNNIIEKLLTVMARIEVTADYPEHDDELKEGILAQQEILSILDMLEKAAETYNTGKLIKSGIQTAIIGKPNVGKSTLLNELAGRQRSIVTDIPGTTRDVIEEEINIDGILLNLMDTAGMRDTQDIVEQIGVSRARESAEDADLIIYMISLEETVCPLEIETPFDLIKDKKTIIVLNKEDVAKVSAKEIIRKLYPCHSNSCHSDPKTKNPNKQQIITTSLTQGKGIEDIKTAIKELFMTGELTQNTEIIITAERHINLIRKSIKSLEDAKNALSNNMPLDILSIDIRNAADALGEITGRSISEDLVDKIFSDFCLGK